MTYLDMKKRYAYGVNIVAEDKITLDDGRYYSVLYRRRPNGSISLEVYKKRVVNKNRVLFKVFGNMKQARSYFNRFVDLEGFD